MSRKFIIAYGMCVIVVYFYAMVTIEICANSIASALHAQNAGAHRLELCDSLETGGLTPSSGLLSVVREKLQIPVHVLIRPRNGDYTYDAHCVEIMRRDIEIVKNLGFEGIVIGALRSDGTLDEAVMDTLIDAANGLSITFHRAFDVASDPFGLTEKLIEWGIDRILTSGRQPIATEGAAFLAELQQRYGRQITIMAGSGIHSGNILDLLKQTGVAECHLSARKQIQGGMVHEINAQFQSELTRYETDPGEVLKILKITAGFTQRASDHQKPHQGRIFP
jgi:copper homeostasis protein